MDGSINDYGADYYLWEGITGITIARFYLN
jgi:hypothetical protein